MRYQTPLICLASFVIIASGLSIASAIVVPFLLALFIAITLSPVLDFMRKIGIGRTIAFFILIAAFVGILWSLGNVIYATIAEFGRDLPQYQAKFGEVMAKIYAKFDEYGLINTDNFVLKSIDPNEIFGTAGAILKQTSDLVTKSFLVFLLLSFMLFETQIFKDKLEYFAAKTPKSQEIALRFISDLKKYLAIKTLSSIATGIIVWAFLWGFGVPYAPLWGVCALLLNYIPTFGSIIAAIPAILICLLTKDFATTLWVAGLYVVVNVLIGNFIEPKFLGRGLGISMLSVILSLLFWGFIFGVAGMFLAVPLTMSAKIALNASPKTKFLAILLSNKVD